MHANLAGKKLYARDDFIDVWYIMNGSLFDKPVKSFLTSESQRTKLCAACGLHPSDLYCSLKNKDFFNEKWSTFHQGCSSKISILFKHMGSVDLVNLVNKKKVMHFWRRWLFSGKGGSTAAWSVARWLLAGRLVCWDRLHLLQWWEWYLLWVAWHPKFVAWLKKVNFYK